MHDPMSLEYQVTARGTATSFGRHRLEEFGLDPTLVHANHGAYGAVPRPVRDAQRAIQDELRANPCGFFRSAYPDRIRHAAKRVAEFLGGEPGDWVFVENATAATNAVVASLDLAAGDEVLTTDQVYGAVRKAIAYRCKRIGAHLVEAAIPMPVSAPEDIFAAVAGAASRRTQLVVLDFVSSPCGIVFPATELCSHFRTLGVPVFLDGAHAPGNIDVDVTALGSDYFAGNAHKWLCAPQGAGLLWCSAEQQRNLAPLVISHGYGLGYTQSFDWPGTHDPSAWLSVPAAIDFHQVNGGTDLRQRNRDVAFAAAEHLAAEFDCPLVAPRAMLSAMATLRLPLAGQLRFEQLEALQQAMQLDHGVVVSLTSAGGASWLRLSAAIYTETADLVEAGCKVLSSPGLNDG